MEQLKWLGVGLVDVEFYFDFIMTFLLSYRVVFSVKVPAIFWRQLKHRYTLINTWPDAGGVGLVHVNKAIFASNK